MIDVKHLSKSFGEVEVLKDINETIEKGEKVVIVGPSGSGKSTFLRCLNLMEKPTSGDIFFEGENITQANEHEMNKLRQRMGMVFQHFNLFPHLTIKKNITLAPVKLGLMTANEADKKAEELLERVGLPDKADEYPSRLSGGQKQRSSIARALLKNAPVLIMDDSLSAVDTDTEEQILENLIRLRKGKTTIIIAHRVSTLQKADHIAVLTEGEMTEYGTHDELIREGGFYAKIYEKQQLEQELNEM